MILSVFYPGHYDLHKHVALTQPFTVEERTAYRVYTLVKTDIGIEGSSKYHCI